MRSELRVGSLTLCALLAGGCGIFHRAPQPPPVVILEAPMFFPASAPGPMPTPADLSPEALPPLRWKVALNLVPPPRLLRRRRPVHETVAPQPASVPPPPPPPLSTGLSPQVQTAYRDQTLATLQQAERDVQTLARRSLTGDAVATREQATEFIRQAQA
ncbi:MAG: hypothetical protein ACRD1Y_02345, partial [Terriglobales bacterium]